MSRALGLDGFYEGHYYNYWGHVGVFGDDAGEMVAVNCKNASMADENLWGNISLLALRYRRPTASATSNHIGSCLACCEDEMDKNTSFFSFRLQRVAQFEAESFSFHVVSRGGRAR